MDFNRKQYDSLSLGYYRGVISHKEICMNRTNLELITECLRSKMLSSKFKLLNWINYHKGFGTMTIIIENNRILCQTFCLTIGYYSLD